MLATFIAIPPTTTTLTLATDVIFPINEFMVTGNSPLSFNLNGDSVTFPNNHTSYTLGINQVFAIQMPSSAVAIRPLRVDGCLDQIAQVVVKTDVAFNLGAGRIAAYHYDSTTTPGNLTQCVPRAAFLIAAEACNNTSQFQALIDAVSSATVSESLSSEFWNLSASIVLPFASSPTELSVQRGSLGHTIYSRTSNGVELFDHQRSLHR